MQLVDNRKCKNAQKWSKNFLKICYFTHLIKEETSVDAFVCVMTNHFPIGDALPAKTRKAFLYLTHLEITHRVQKYDRLQNLLKVWTCEN